MVAGVCVRQDSDSGSADESGADQGPGSGLRMPAKQRMQALVLNITQLPLDPLLASQVPAPGSRILVPETRIPDPETRNPYLT